MNTEHNIEPKKNPPRRYLKRALLSRAPATQHQQSEEGFQTRGRSPRQTDGFDHDRDTLESRRGILLCVPEGAGPLGSKNCPYDGGSRTNYPEHRIRSVIIIQKEQRRVALVLQFLVILISLVLLLLKQGEQSPTDVANSRICGFGGRLSFAEATSIGTDDDPIHDLHDDSTPGAVLKIHHTNERERRRLVSEDEKCGTAQQPPQHPSVIIVAAVDGTLAGISKLSGQVLWKRSSSSSQQISSSLRPNNSVVLRPLVATTTTKMSVKQPNNEWKTAAVPSVDGSVYLTASSSSSSSGAPRTTTTTYDRDEQELQPSEEVTVTTLLPDLVARAPFVDARGRIYTGSRHSTTFAIDSDTGELLHVFPDWDRPNFFSSAATVAEDTTTTNNGHSSSVDAAGTVWQDPTSKHKRNVVWLGRVDYAVSVHEPQSGQLDVQFASGSIIGAQDMWLGNSNNDPLHDQEPWSDSTPHSERLMATPNGNVAFRSGDDSNAPIEWVANECFDTPVAYAVDAATGRSLPVDIFPDAAVPHGSTDYVSKEMERQMQLVLQQYHDDGRPPPERLPDGHDLLESQGNDEQTIVGSLSSGDLFAMPLGRRRGWSQSRDSSTALMAANGYLPADLDPLHHHHSGVSSSSASAAAASKTLHVARIQHGRHQSSLQQQHPYHPSEKHGKGTCFPGDPNFPNCLVRKQPPHGGTAGGPYWQVDSHFLSETVPADTDPNVAALVVKYQYPDPASNWYIPPPHYYTMVNPPTKRQKRYQKLLRILGSWLPPTIALLFVVSFELGRRKRQERRMHGTQNELDQSILGPLSNHRTNEGRESLVDADGARFESIGVIQVFDDVILGYGCHGTVVYKGMLEGRQVAVKRMLRAYHASADREISLLIESDGHPNVVRYFLKEVRGDFVYLALELCDLSLHDLVQKLKERQDQYEKENLAPPSVSQATRTVLLEIASGVRHLHRLRIVHRDLKPMNILLADSRNKSNRKYKDTADLPVCQVFESGFYVAKISDMGLGKQLMGQSSYGGSLIPEGSLRGVSNGGQSSIVGMGPGSVGWQAPEVMALRTLPSDASARSDESVGVVHESSFPDASPIDVTIGAQTSRSVDIFSLGCVFYSTLIPGCHPFGEWYERESNIMKNKPSIHELEELSPDAFDLVASMIHRNPLARPTAAQICVHPFFWDEERRMSFLCDFSDRIESEGLQLERSTCDCALNAIALAVERNASKVVGLSWDSLLDDDLVNNVQRFRTYDPSSVRDLLRLIRNKYHHFDELPVDMKLALGSKADGLVRYFEVRFPRLLIHCFNICRELLPIDDGLCQKYAIAPACKSAEKTLATQLSKRTTSISADKNAVVERLDLAFNPGQSNNDAPFVVANTEIPEEPKDVVPPPTPDVVECDESNGNPSLSFNQPDEPNFVDTPEDSSDTVVEPSLAGPVPDDVVVWEGSNAARALHCRGWSRSDGEWERRMDAKLRKRDTNLVRCAEDPKFRTRLCNYWDLSLGTSCPMRKKNKCIFAHGPVELRVKGGKRHRWGKLVDKNGDNNNPNHSGGEDTYGAARSIEKERQQEGKWGSDKKHSAKPKGKKSTTKKQAQT